MFYKDLALCCVIYLLNCPHSS